MTLRIDLAPSGARTQQFDASQRGAAQTGTFKGETVRLQDNAFDLTSAAEELSLGMASKIEQKTHAERSIRPGERPRLQTIARITEYFEKARHAATPQELESLARRLLKGDQDPGRLVREQPGFRAPTDQYLLLQYARQLGASTGATPQVMERIEDALSDLEDWHGRQIQANLATIDQAGRYADTAQDVARFQGSVQVVLGKPSLAQALQEVLHLAGAAGAKLESSLHNLMEALGACLAGMRAGSDKAQLQTLVTDLYHLKSLRTVLDDCRRLVKDMRKRQKARAGKAGRGRPDEGETEEDRSHARR